MRGKRWAGWVIAAMGLVVAVTTSVTAVAINLATSGSNAWLSPVQAHPFWWTAGGTVAVGFSGVALWWLQRALGDRRRPALVPPGRRPESWIVDRPDEVEKVVSALVSGRRRGGDRSAALSIAVRGAGGFGKTVIARLVEGHPQVRRRFVGGVYWTTLGRDVASPAALAERVTQLINRLDQEQQVSFTDLEQAADHLAAVLAAGPRRLLILDDVWHADQPRAFPVAGQCARLITTRIPSILTGSPVMITVGEVTQEQARAIVGFGLAKRVSGASLRALLAETGRYPLLLRLVNEYLSKQVATGRLVDDVAAEVVNRLRELGTSGVDGLTREDGRPLDINDPVARSSAVAATIEASLGLLTPEQRDLFVQTSVFGEDEAVPIRLVGLLWATTASLDEAQSRALCLRLQDLALIGIDDHVPGGALRLHDVIRDHLRASLDPDALTRLHQSLVTAIANTVPTSAAATSDGDTSSADRVRAWWLLPEAERYAYDHLIEHLISANRGAEAEVLATDLRWVARRLQLANANAPYTDLTKSTTARAGDLARLIAGAAHLLGPTDPAHSLIDILCSRVAHDPIWGPQAAELLAAQPGTHLVSRWDLIDLPASDLRRTLAGHTGAVNDVAVAPDGSWLATAGHDATVRLWDAATGGHRATLTHRNAVRAVAISPDGTWLATASGFGTVHLWDVAAGKIRATLPGHKGTVDSIAISPDGSWLATGHGREGRVLLWNAATGKIRGTIDCYRHEVKSMAVSPDGTWLATLHTFDRMVLLWDILTAAEPRTVIRTFYGWVTSIAISPNGMWLAMGDEDGNVALWDSASGEHRIVLTHGAGFVEAMCISADGSWLATAAHGTTRLWDVETGEIRAALTGHTSQVTAITTAPDGTWLVTASKDGTARIWDNTSARRNPLAGETRKDLATADRQEKLKRTTARRYNELLQLWADAADTPSTILVRPGDPTTAYSPDGTLFARPDPDLKHEGTVHVFDAATGERRHTLVGHTDVVQIVTFAPDGTWLVTGTSTYDETIRLWDAATGEIRHVLHGTPAGVEQLAIAPDGSWLAANCGGTVWLWDTSTAEIRGVLAHQSTLKVIPDGTWLATADLNGVIHLWDTTGKNRAVLIGHTDWINGLAASSDGSWIVTASSDCTARLWDAAAGESRALLRHTGPVKAVVIAPEETRLATISGDRALRVWDAATGEAIAMMRLDRQPEKLAWSPFGDEIAVLASGGSEYLFEITC